jgi:formate hydrogenlyase subunit 4
MNAIYYLLFQIVIVLLFAPLVNGVIGKIKALTQKRTGPPVLQMYFDLHKLLRKSAVVSDVSSWIFRVTPYIVFATALSAALLVPVTVSIIPVGVLPTGLPGDLILLFYLLALGRFFICLAALDTASTFGGMGASREVMISSLIEPTVIVVVITLGLISKSTSVFAIMQTMSAGGTSFIGPVLIVLFLAMLIVLIAETSRIPIDDPATHLELTMVHEAMILEYSGRHLALMEYGAVIKQMMLMTLMVNVFVPLDFLVTVPGLPGSLLLLLLYLCKMLLLSVVVALIEVNTVKVRFFSIPNLAALSFILAFLGFMQYFVLGRS